MDDTAKLFIGGSRNPDDSLNKAEYLELKFGNRHGLVTGATGTGKTVSLQILAEGFSKAGVPVFAADIKGDLSGIAMKGEPKDFLLKRAEAIGLADYEFEQFPVIFWDLFGEKGHRVRTTIAEMGPLLLSRLMDASEPQEGVINIAFKIADEAGMPLLDLKDFTALLNYMAENANALSSQFGLISKTSVASIQRALLVLEQQGAEHFFGEPALKISDIMRTANNGYGQISVLAADKLMMNPRLYATFLLWLLSELFEELPEVGDPDKPKLVFFFDEAHLLFDDAPKVLIERVEQVVRLIRSKGVGVYFVTQNPLDVPESVLAQLGNRVQHALRAYTPREQKAVKTAADTFRPNPAFDCAEAITNLGTGEALVSTLEGKGAPSIVERTLVRPPASRIGAITDQERQAIIDKSPVLGVYDEDLDRESAFEMLAARAKQAADAAAAKEKKDDAEASAGSGWTLPGFGTDDDNRGAAKPRRSGYQRETVVEAAMKSVARTVATQVGRALVRGILGSLKR
ncbi:helicase HerA-like C-terminal domain-containing protein [Neorhizobium sp. Rsf11]|uniref:Helicase HerA-like C-terminal domain-containing protein n=1 Tax=Neorhizobium phenanthreniclasticum TaxID=3157917 RepID=A0ABV0M715_9HYPH